MANTEKNEDIDTVSGTGRRPPWKILIVDDDPVVHEITRQVLAAAEFENRGMEFFSAYSGLEAKSRMAENPDTAAVLLDVVMESDSAGLEVAEYIRKELKNEYTRIILRTGQPGEAPERKIILEYDINDYKDKTELTATKLYTAIISSIRDYSLLIRLDRCLVGMETTVKYLNELHKFRSFVQFAEGILTQVISLLNLEENGLYVGVTGCAAETCDDDYTILAGTGEFAAERYRNGSDGLPVNVVSLLDRAIAEKHHLYNGSEFVGYIPSEKSDTIRLLYLTGVYHLEKKQRYLLETFLTNVNIAFDNVLELEAIRAGEQ